MESESRKLWLPTQALNLLISFFVLCCLVYGVGSCGSKKNEATIKYERLIDSITSDFNNYYIDLQAIDESRIRQLQFDVNKFQTESAFIENENAQSSLHTAEKFLSTLSEERNICLKEMELKKNILQKTKKDAATILTTNAENQLQMLNQKQFDEVKYRAEYLINRFNAHILLIETLTKAKEKHSE
jgi:hypothetical protein